MPKVESDIFLSNTLMTGCELLIGEEATEFLKGKGFTHIFVDDDGKIHALSSKNTVVEGMYVYKRQKSLL